jgi:class 3 adenylate cyclase
MTAVGAPAPEGTRLLLVDDQEMNCKLLTATLAQAGFGAVRSVNDARQAVSVFLDYQPDLLLLDLHMPHRDGFAVMEELRPHVPDDVYFPIIVLTADITREAKLRALSLGAADFLRKPFDPTEIGLRVKNLLELRRLHGQLESRTRMVRQLLGRYVADPVVDHLLSDPARARLGGQRVEATILFGDLRGFTSLMEPLAAEEAVDVLNDFLTPMVDIIQEHGGMLDKFRGDGVMAVFGVPQASPNDPLKACAAALAMQARTGRLEVPGQPGRRLQMGIGINTGSVVAGNIGAPQRHDFTVIGDAVNLAARFESNAGPGQVLITEATYERLGGRVEVLPLGTIRAKGRIEWVNAYQLLRAERL